MTPYPDNVMRPNLKAMLVNAPEELREAYIDARAEIPDNRPDELEAYDREMERTLMRECKHASVVAEPKAGDAPDRKRVELMQRK